MKFLEDLGYNSFFDKFIKSIDLKDFMIGRVVRQGKNIYIIKTSDGDFEGNISGKLRYNAKIKSDYPAIGDWVLVEYIESQEQVRIHEILPRKTIIERQEIGGFGKNQVIATNVDVAFIVQDIAYDFNLKRIDRFLAICFASKIHPEIIFTKIDIIDKIKLDSYLKKTFKRFGDISVTSLSNKTMKGFTNLKKIINYGKTYCFIGASGAGKSTLINNLVGETVMITKSLREKTYKGQHTTSHRELFILKNSGIIIDTPGVREIGITNNESTLESAFEAIYNIAKSCKFSDCKHLIEPGCKVLLALENGEIEKSFYDNYHKMKEEQVLFKDAKRGIKNNQAIKKMKSDPNNKKTKR